MNNSEPKYCQHCDEEIIDTSIFCPKCGSQVKAIKVTTVQPEPTITPKSRTLAILIAIMFGLWSWLYTYTKSKNKFWASILGLSALFVFLFIYSFTAIFADATLDLGYLAPIVIGGTWLWAILDNAIKPRSFYEKYPLG